MKIKMSLLLAAILIAAMSVTFLALGSCDDDDDESVSCVCEDATLAVVSGCDGWPDATDCSGLHSVWCVEEMDEEEDDCTLDIFDDWTFETGDSFTGYGCTISVTCPE